MNDTPLSIQLLALEPATIDADDGQLILGIRGTGFTMHSQVFFGDDPQPTGMLGPDLLAVPIHPGLHGPGVIDVKVTDLDGKATAIVPFTITEKQHGQEQPDEQPEVG